jgi:hypothetical protein
VLPPYKEQAMSAIIYPLYIHQNFERRWKAMVAAKNKAVCRPASQGTLICSKVSSSGRRIYAAGHQLVASADVHSSEILEDEAEM